MVSSVPESRSLNDRLLSLFYRPSLEGTLGKDVLVRTGPAC